MTLDQSGEDTANTNNAVSEGGQDFIGIGEMSRKYGVTLRTLRYYEDKGLISPKRNGSTRLYSRRDSARLKLILLGRKVGFSVRDLKQVLDLHDPAGSNTKQFRLALYKSEKQLARLQEQQQAIERAIKALSGMMRIVSRTLAKRTVAPTGSAR